MSSNAEFILRLLFEKDEEFLKAFSDRDYISEKELKDYEWKYEPVTIYDRGPSDTHILRYTNFSQPISVFRSEILSKIKIKLKNSLSLNQEFNKDTVDYFSYKNSPVYLNIGNAYFLNLPCMEDYSSIVCNVLFFPNKVQYQNLHLCVDENFREKIEYIELEHKFLDKFVRGTFTITNMNVGNKEKFLRYSEGMVTFHDNMS